MKGQDGTLQTVTHAGLRAEYDPGADALYVYLSDQEYAYGRDLDDARRVDYAADDSPVGVEVLSPRAAGVAVAGLPAADRIAEIVRRLGFRVTAEAALG